MVEVDWGEDLGEREITNTGGIRNGKLVMKIYFDNDISFEYMSSSEGYKNLIQDAFSLTPIITG